MKYLLAAATFAALLTATPASAQTVYGATIGDSAGATIATGGNWKSNFLIYAEGPDSILLDKLTAPLGDVGAPAVGTDGGVAFDLSAGTIGSANVSGFGGVGANAVDPVPEPATWAMMLVGFGAVGGALRSRRKATLRYA